MPPKSPSFYNKKKVKMGGLFRAVSSPHTPFLERTALRMALWDQLFICHILTPAPCVRARVWGREGTSRLASWCQYGSTRARLTRWGESLHNPVFTICQASKDKSGKFSDNFNVTLFLVRPNDQTLQAEFSRSNLICQVRKDMELASELAHAMVSWWSTVSLASSTSTSPSNPGLARL